MVRINVPAAGILPVSPNKSNFRPYSKSQVHSDISTRGYPTCHSSRLNSSRQAMKSQQMNYSDAIYRPDYRPHHEAIESGVKLAGNFANSIFAGIGILGTAAAAGLSGLIRL